MEKNTDVEVWTVSDLIESLKDIPSKKKKIKIPKFQRTLVWKDEQRKTLIDSIRSGLPIGAILLNRIGDEKRKINGEDISIINYNLIDGLQRITTLKEYTDRPLQFLRPDNLDENVLEEITNFYKNEDNDITIENIRKDVYNWLTKITEFSEKGKFSSYYLVSHLNKKYQFNENSNDLVEKLADFFDGLKKDSDINSFEIPIIIYNGTINKLPTIFERINSKGTQLNKYQIFAATWTKYNTFEIQNLDIVDKIKEKYDYLIENGFEVHEYDPITFNKSKFTYFEYLFGFGKYIAEKYPLLFKSSKNDHETDSFGFNIVAICLNHDLRNLVTLPETLGKYELSKVEETTLEIITFLNGILKPYIGLKANKKNNKPYPIVHTEYQIASFIGKLFRSKYDNDLNELDEWKVKSKKFKKTIPMHYLYDILNNFWSGTGDSKAVERARTDKYEKTISKEMWESLLNNMHEEDKTKQEKKRPSIKKEHVLFLKYLYAHIISSFDEISPIEFHVEHIISVKRLKKLAEKNNGLPISAVANLALLKKDLNIDKKDKTIYEYYEKDNNLTEEQKKKKIEDAEKYTFTEKSDLEFISDDKLSDETKIDKYFNYLDNRFENIKKIFYEYNNIA